ncbi:hypothetical protein [Achromobacter phage ewik_TL4]|nr:hypothetical protein [Achromobacter phage hasilly_LB3]WNO48779.1 hypothetical protein [Achromobacter phage nyaak_TL1]WNO48906.1 hypothetical protein [Achromobacter phage kuwaak_TL2]WNO48972.1 hypothetical protein [Achromobacter phage ewii_LB8]WNO49033.1 hypothetical protein [Achromobacter phage emuu_LB7]WNO49246.1 hypothetical protein [Achromobacter phage ewik_TL4]WOZ53381.1 hypothetical protein [Achromobacter phage tuull]
MKLVIDRCDSYDADSNSIVVEGMGFVDAESGVFVTDPFVSDCGRFPYDLQQAKFYYKLTTSEVLQIVRHNSSLGLIMDCFNSYDFEKVRNMCFRSKK